MPTSGEGEGGKEEGNAAGPASQLSDRHRRRAGGLDEDQTSDPQHIPSWTDRPRTPGGWRPDSQVRDARLAHGRGDGFDRGAERVEQLGHLAGAAGLPALLHDEAGQGDDIRVEGRLVRHAGAGLCVPGGEDEQDSAGRAEGRARGLRAQDLTSPGSSRR